MKKLMLLPLFLLTTLACSKPVVVQTTPVPAINGNMVVCPKCGTPIQLPPNQSLMNKIFG